jgi:hypothetical protein
MIKISGAYSYDISDVLTRINQASKLLENYTIDGDTQGTVIQSFREINTAASNTVKELLELQHQLNEMLHNFKLSIENE